MARGGRRTGTPGQNYRNRTDLTLPAQVAPGGTYGTRQQLEASQRVIPLPSANAPAPQAVPPPAVPGPQPTQPAGGGMPQLDFARTSERPNEPVTAGLPNSPGPGPEVLGSQDMNAGDIHAWQPYLPSLEFLASQPNSSASTRNFVRRIRSLLPPGQ